MGHGELSPQAQAVETRTLSFTLGKTGERWGPHATRCRCVPSPPPAAAIQLPTWLRCFRRALYYFDRRAVCEMSSAEKGFRGHFLHANSYVAEFFALIFGDHVLCIIQSTGGQGEDFRVVPTV